MFQHIKYLVLIDSHSMIFWEANQIFDLRVLLHYLLYVVDHFVGYQLIIICI